MRAMAGVRCATVFEPARGYRSSSCAIQPANFPHMNPDVLYVMSRLLRPFHLGRVTSQLACDLERLGV